MKVTYLFLFTIIVSLFNNGILAQSNPEESLTIDTELIESPASLDIENSELQRKLISYTDKVLNTSIDRGECWDYVAAALDDAGAKWERPKSFGREVDWKKDGIQNGDVILYEKVSLAAPDFSSSAYFYKHYAMVYEVKEGLKFTMAHQNYADKKTVHFSEIDFNHLQSGKISVWRPSGS